MYILKKNRNDIEVIIVKGMPFYRRNDQLWCLYVDWDQINNHSTTTQDIQLIYAVYNAVGRHPGCISSQNLVVKSYPGSTSFILLFCIVHV